MLFPEFSRLTADQLAGADFISSRPVTMLADIPGLGKTAQAIHAFDMAGCRRGLVICPSVLCENWRREFMAWSFVGYPLQIIRTGKDEVMADGVVIVSYKLAAVPRIRRLLNKRGGDWLFVDEAHRLKSVKSEQSKAVLLANGVAWNFRRMTWLTGTPAPNDGTEFYTFLKASGAWRGNRSALISAFFEEVKGEYGCKIVGNSDVEGFKKLLAPVYLRRTKIEGLPPLVTDTIFVDGAAGGMAALAECLTPEVRSGIERALEADEWQFFDTPHIASIRRLTGVAKSSATASLIEHELADGEDCIIVFAQHSDVIAAIAERLSKAGVTFGVIEGATSGKARQRAIDEFQAGRLQVIICQLQAASEGITLTRSARVILAEYDWTPARNEQAIKRAQRRGQMRDVRASYVLLSQSLDEQVLKTLARKTAQLAEIV
jgi:SWI/SNF-related matrix-associated actin-dependent regulator 1 of chromatin subfamily A